MIKEPEQLVDVAIPNNNNVLNKFQEKKSKYTDLAVEIKQMWHLDEIDIVLVIISSTGLIPKRLHDSLKKLELHKNTNIEMQKAVIFNTCRIVRKFMSSIL
ncbi:hypothetical protein HHI36_006143 [Cryptolaemus montrouzieri]|uniref:Uncharacterized protein n=1 Tax=Cryptolaemus montrouzieri TaxID=559131 RepID=A0ABD2NWE5_9CUCU